MARGPTSSGCATLADLAADGSRAHSLTIPGAAAQPNVSQFALIGAPATPLSLDSADPGFPRAPIVPSSGLASLPR
jgi:hypothetical protein